MKHLFLLVIVSSYIVNGQMPKKQPILPQVEDIPFIQCDVCQRSAKALFKEVKSKREEKKPLKLNEDEILSIVEKTCDPDSDHGKWMRYLDITEVKDSLKIREHSKFGRCREECKTIARSCDQTIGDIDTDLGEILWQNELKLSPFINEVCYSLSNVCSKKVPKFVKGKRKDFDFIEMSQKDIDAEKVLANMRGMPGIPGMEMYSAEDLQNMREDMGIDEEGMYDGEMPTEQQQQQQQQQQQSGKKQQQRSQQQYTSQLGFFDTVKEVGKDLFRKGKKLFGYSDKDEL